MNQFIITILVLLFGRLSAQTNRCYTYDNAGNRITKNICYSFKVMPETADLPDHIPEIDLGQRTTVQYDLRIVPNPSDGHFEIQTKGYSPEAKYIILNPAGQSVSSGYLNLGNILDLTFLPDGTYKLKISEKEQHHSTKIIIIH